MGKNNHDRNAIFIFKENFYFSDSKISLDVKWLGAAISGDLLDAMDRVHRLKTCVE